MKHNIKHLMSHSKIYGVWRGMLKRCHSTDKTFKTYRLKGIQVCDLWKNNFVLFKDWALANGYAEGLQIDRINNNGNYEPLNCRFVTPLQNTNNRDITVMVNYNGAVLSFSNILHEKNLQDNYHAIRTRIKRGWPVEKAIDTPVKLKR